MDKITITQSITLAIAILGAVLGILNTWRNIVKDRLKIKVRPSNMFIFGNEFLSQKVSKKGVSVEVINLSTSPVSIIEIGFANFHRFRNKIKGGKYIPSDLKNTENKTMPVRLASRESATFYVLNDSLKNLDSAEIIKYSYARTACGNFIKGTSTLFKEALEDAKK